ncbi:unnamed protein product [Ilex paraguariensis]|uniref:Uncharacterized protein n=1 Tax=Ilex paraguariensis TaxID=185542 RepID=A0ABC8SYA1_9AQUA
MASSGNSSGTSVKDKTLTGVGSLIRLLPTGTVFLYQFLNPVLTNNGHCHTINKYFSGILIAISGLACFFSTFTDSYTDSDGKTHYGIATPKGFWPSAGSLDLSPYKLGFGDFAHAFFSLIVFSVVVILDNNTVECFYPSFVSSEKLVIMVLPPVLGALSSSIFMVFPNKRHGIGYPLTPSSSQGSVSNSLN